MKLMTIQLVVTIQARDDETRTASHFAKDYAASAVLFPRTTLDNVLVLSSIGFKDTEIKK